MLVSMANAPYIIQVLKMEEVNLILQYFYKVIFLSL